MKSVRASIAAAELLLIFPAALFMASLIVRSLQPTQYEPAHIAQRIVDTYSHSAPIGLWLLLMAFPLIVLTTGCITLLRAWRSNAELRSAAHTTLHFARAPLATLFVAAATLAAGVILAIVALHEVAG
jgi:hypothetical protein